MPPFNRTLKRLAWLGFWCGTTAATYVSCVWLLRQDPLKGYKQPLPAGVREQDGIAMDGVLIKHFSGKLLVTSAVVDKVRVRQDRQFVEFNGIKQGTYAGKEGQVQFEGDAANWTTTSKLLTVVSDSRVWDKNIDIKAGPFTVDKNTSVLHVPGNFSGKFFGGNVVGNNLRYNLKTASWTMGPIDWAGELPASIQKDSPVQGKQRSKWSVKAPGGSHSDGKTTTYLKVLATDGEVVVKADKAVQDLKTDVMTCTGNVSYFSTKADMSADTVVIYRKEKRMTATGHVNSLLRSKEAELPKAEPKEIPPLKPDVPESVASTRPEPPTDADTQAPDLRDPKNARKYPVNATAKRVEYWYGKGNRHANLDGAVEAYQELPGGRWRRITAPDGAYDGEKDLLKLRSSSGKKNVHMKDSWLDNIVCRTLTISTKDDQENNAYDAEDMEGDVYTNEDEVPTGDAKKGDGRGGGGKPQPPSELSGKGFGG